MDIAELLAFSVKNNASDLHLSAGVAPMIRVDGVLRRINLPPMEHKEIQALVYDLMDEKQRKKYEKHHEALFTFALPDLRGRTPIHEGTGNGLSFRYLGSKAGAETTGR